MRRKPAPYLRLLLILALLWSQVAGLVHCVGHGVTGERAALVQLDGDGGLDQGHQGEGKVQTAGHTCADCLAFSALGAAITSQVASVPAPSAHTPTLAPVFTDRTAAPVFPYLSRGPPALS